MIDRQKVYRVGLLLGCAVLAQPSFAETSVPRATADAANLPSDVGADAGTVDEDRSDIVVTGSRIRRDVNDAPAPIAVVTADEIRTVGSGQIVDVVNQLPALAITQTNQTSNLAGNAGINALDLRGMGTQRTLVLVDGRRQVPAIPGTSAVDLSNIPSSLVERVEVVTGGASALYGADAVAGVANFILKKNFQGIESNLQYSQSTRNDMNTYSFDILAGTNFSDGRGNVTVYGFYDNQPGLVAGEDRPWTAAGYPYYARASSSEKYGISDGNYNIYSSNSAQVILADKLYAIDGNGKLRAPVLGPSGFTNLTAVNMANTSEALGTLLTDGGEYNGRYDGWLLSVPSERFSTRVSSHYDFSDAFRLFGNVSFSRNTSTAAYDSLTGFGYDAVPADSPFITSEILAAAGGVIPEGGINFARRVTEVGRPETQYRRKTLQAVAGAEGDFRLFGKAWNYSAYYSYGRSEEQVRDVNTTSYDRWYLGLDSTTDGNGNAVCRSTLSDPTNGCVAINPFMTLTPQMIDYIQYTSSWGKSVMTQQVASAYVSGGLLDLPGGTLQAVVGAEYRNERNDIGVIPEYDATSTAYDASLGTTAVPLIGKYSVKEVYGELHAPLLRDLFAVHSLSIDGAVRLSDYSTAGRTTTWKIGGEWAPIRDLRFRATYGQAVRAPNIEELYTASSTSGLWVTDPCQSWNLENRVTRTQYTEANCAALKPTDLTNYWIYRDVIAKGNLDLKPEVARTLTVGGVLEPRFVPGLSLTVDYFDIDLRDAIDAFGAQTLIDKCVDQPTLENVFCDLVTRDSGNNIVSVTTQKLNLAQYLTRGIDFGLNYSLGLERLGLGAKAGRIEISANYTRLLNRRYTLDPTDPDTTTEFRGVFGSPTWKGVIRTTYSQPTWGGTWTVRHFSPMKASSTITSEDYDPIFTPNVFYNDIYGWVKLTKNIELSGGLNNVFDRAPPRIPGAEAGGANFELSYQAGVYDVIGRTFFLRLRFTR
ncbi:TonB-dependent Receptor Plug Domain [Novosphingobium sp. CF614]|uniref:TonB-dependent receptor plug domain-containing protein n=1 Tax=Novosphingobium sp. CF614 TaxID=1884364 RepID=UPI0008ECE310|nr:TonB-dependent receptor [Novosphingobium sp. CF614]SFG35674.1 TonB-dependent Receptor Plug Domain [Novosphingobium sp. CF614]